MGRRIPNPAGHTAAPCSLQPGTHLGAILGLSWGHLEIILGGFGDILGHLETILEHLGEMLRIHSKTNDFYSFFNTF